MTCAAVRRGVSGRRAMADPARPSPAVTPPVAGNRRSGPDPVPDPARGAPHGRLVPENATEAWNEVAAASVTASGIAVEGPVARQGRPEG